MVTRVPVLEIRPCLERGRHPAKAIPGEGLRIDAIVLADDAQVGAAAVLVDPDGAPRAPVAMRPIGDDVWSATVVPDAVGHWTYAVQTWQEPLRTWAAQVVHDIDQGVDIGYELARGSSLVLTCTESDPAALQVARDMLDDDTSALDRLAMALAFVESLPAEAGRLHLDSSEPLPLRVDPEHALTGAWYQLFPLSTGAERQADGAVRPGNLVAAAQELESVAAMGFDVVRLPPLHPSAAATPWQVGSALGGHDAIDPRLGTLDDFEAFVQRAHQLSMEVALELSWTVTSEHPWFAQHSGWLRPAGPDVWTLDVDADPGAVYTAVLDVFTTWIDRGVGAFVLHDAHRWPLAFWEQLLRDVAAISPDVVVLAEGDTSAAQAHALAMIGVHQTTPALHAAGGVREVHELLQSLGRGSVSRPHLVASSSHSVPPALQDADATPATFRAWAAVAALASPAWGVRAGFERGHTLASGQLDGTAVHEPSADAALTPFLTRLNEVRRAHVALQRRRGLVVHRVQHAGVLAFSRRCGDDAVLVVIDLYPSFDKVVSVPGDLADVEQVQDELDGSWHALEAIPLSPEQPVRVFALQR